MPEPVPVPRAADCDAVADDLVEVAFRVREPVEVPGLADHLERCPSCRAELDELTRAADHVALAAAEVEPPDGFAGRAVAAMAVPAPPAPPATPVAPAVPARRRQVRVLVGAMAFLVLLLGGVVLWRTTGTGSTPVASAPDGPRSARLLGTDGAPVGGLRVTSGTPAEMTVWLDGTVSGAAYRCEVVLADGTRRDVGTWTPGAPGEPWTVGLDDTAAAARRVEIVTPEGSTVAAAAL